MDTSLMQPENLVLNPVDKASDEGSKYHPWFMPYLLQDGENINKVLSAQWYQDTVTLENNPEVFICPLILYVDKTFIDPMRSQFNLEPLSFTLAIFKHQCRSQFKFWWTLGYLPDQPVADSDVKSRNYHAMLQHLLCDVITIHNNCILITFTSALAIMSRKFY
jgi:hypothetical protein